MIEENHMAIPPGQRTRLEYYCASLFYNDFMKDFPILKYAIFKLVRVRSQSDYPDLLESLNIFGRQIAAFGLGVSLCSWSFLPGVCCASLMVIFKKTIFELRQRKKDAQKIEELSSKIDELSCIMRASKVNTKQIKATTKHLQKLKEEEQALLEKYVKTQQKYAIVANLLKHECKKFSDNNRKLANQVTKLTSIKK